MHLPSERPFALDRAGSPRSFSALLCRLTGGAHPTTAALQVDLIRDLPPRFSLTRAGDDIRCDAEQVATVGAWTTLMAARLQGVSGVELRGQGGSCRDYHPLADLSLMVATVKAQLCLEAERRGLASWRRADIVLQSPAISNTPRRPCFFSEASGLLPDAALREDSPLAQTCSSIERAVGLWLGPQATARLVIATAPASRHEILDALRGAAG